LEHKDVLDWVRTKTKWSSVCLIDANHREAQRDADVEWYRDKTHKQDSIWQQQIEQARQGVAREIFEEIGNLAVIAPFHKGQPDTMYWQLSTDGWQEIKSKYIK
jgi:hypothetical protein